MSSKNKDEKLYMRINNQIYDLTNFRKKHPGGSVLKVYKNMDATDVFYAFHERSDKAKRLLNVLPHKPAEESEIKIEDDAKDPLVEDFRKLRLELVEEGYFKPIFWIQILRVIEVVLLHFLSFYVAATYNFFLGGILYGLTIGRNGLLMHDAGHRAFAGDMFWDKIAHTIIFTFAASGSASFWNNQHNKHHAATQELEHDTDLFTLPVIAFNRRVAKYGNPHWLRFQWISFIPAQFGLFLYWKFTHTRHMIRTKNWGELGSLLGHEVVGWLVVLNTHLKLSEYYAMEFIGYMVAGCYLATTFSLNHTHRPVVDPFTKRDWVRRSAEFTTDVEPSYFNTWITGYLNYQIEHHLFPNIPHPRLPGVSQKIKKLFAKHSLKYDCRSISNAFADTIDNLYQVGKDAYEAALKEKTK